jgi:hypothetical protein
MTDRDRDPYLCDHGLPIPGACYSCDPPRDDYTVEEQHAMTRPPADPPATPCESCGSTESCYHDLVDDPGEPATPPVDDDDNLSCASCGTGEDECEGLMDDLGERCCKTCHHVVTGDPATLLDERPPASEGGEVLYEVDLAHVGVRRIVMDRYGCPEVQDGQGRPAPGGQLAAHLARDLAAERAARVAAEGERDRARCEVDEVHVRRACDECLRAAHRDREALVEARQATERAEARATAAERGRTERLAANTNLRKRLAAAKGDRETTEMALKGAQRSVEHWQERCAAAERQRDEFAASADACRRETLAAEGALAQAVEAAYREGHEDGQVVGYEGGAKQGRQSADWNDSNARARLAAGNETTGGTT